MSDKYLKLMSEMKPLIFLPRLSLFTVLPVSVDGNSILPTAQDESLGVIHPVHWDIPKNPTFKTHSELDHFSLIAPLTSWSKRSGHFPMTVVGT